MDFISLIQLLFLVGFVVFIALGMAASSLAAGVAKARQEGLELYPEVMDLRARAQSKGSLARAVLFSKLPRIMPAGLRAKAWLYRVLAAVYAVSFLAMVGVVAQVGSSFIFRPHH